MSRYTLPLDSPESRLHNAGGKGANLSILMRAGLNVPGGFVITTSAYEDYVDHNRLRQAIQRELESHDLQDVGGLTEASKAIDEMFGEGALPHGLRDEVLERYDSMGRPPVAVRSSATAEDLPGLSFAGQQDTFLDVEGDDRLFEAVVACWSSLWTPRAIGYRARNGVPQSGVSIAVVVQRMVHGAASGVMFTSNPLTGKRSELVIEAIRGLGDALVSGQVEPDRYTIDRGTATVAEKTIGGEGDEPKSNQVLPNDVISELSKQGSRIATLYGGPQDVEWAWEDDRLYILQARPITSLYPLPETTQGRRLRVYLSLATVQGFLDPFTPIGQDVLRQSIAYASAAIGRPVTFERLEAMVPAGERIFIDITGLVENRRTHPIVLAFSTMMEGGMRRTIESIMRDPDLQLNSRLPPAGTLVTIVSFASRLLSQVVLNLARPDSRRDGLIRESEQLLGELDEKQRSAKGGAEQYKVIHGTLQRTVSYVVNRYLPFVVAGMAMFVRLRAQAEQLGLGSESLNISRGLPYNVTTEMDLALWAAVERLTRDPDSARVLSEADTEELTGLYTGGQLPTMFQGEVDGFISRYGMRGVGEIDIGTDRWRDDPRPLMRAMKAYAGISDPDKAPSRVFEASRESAEGFIERMVEARRRTRLGWLGSRKSRWMTHRYRALGGLREGPKFFIVRCLGVAREALLAIGEELTEGGVVSEPGDVFFLRLNELPEALGGGDRDWSMLIEGRRRVFEAEMRRRQIPLLLLSDGRAFYGAEAAVDPSDGSSFTGAPVSPGVVEGPAHVMRSPRDSQLMPGEVLVCPATDPAWTPLFLAASGLVMEVGGMMTHGSVVAREYGIPAVVGVRNATALIKTGQMLRVDGSSGTVSVLKGSPRGEADAKRPGSL